MKLFAPFNLRNQWRSHWAARAAIAADLIVSHAPEGSRIADLGCGDQKLRKALKQFPCWYRGYDLVPQSDDVIPIDITADPLPECDVTAMLGVLEYVPIEPVLEKIRSPLLVVSHLYPDEGAFPAKVIKSKGWLNVLPKAEFEARLTQAGFRIISCTPADQQHVWLASRECRRGNDVATI